MNNAQDIIARLPRVTIESLPYDGRTGHGTLDRRPRERRGTWSVVVGVSEIRLSMKNVSRVGRFTFTFGGDLADNPKIEPGESYPCIDWSYSGCITWVLDRAMQWTHTEFQPSDVWEWKLPGYTFQAPVDGSVAKGHEFKRLHGEPHRVVVGAWDHEHCGICSTRICQVDGPWGYLNPETIWICETCHASYIAANSIDFIEKYTMRPNRWRWLSFDYWKLRRTMKWLESGQASR